MDDQTVLSRGLAPARLLVVQGPLAGREIALAQDEIALGRDPGLALTIDDPEISRRHARVFLQRGEYVLEDLGSTNGTTLNGVQIDAPQILKAGDIIGVGHTSLQFVGEAEAQYRPAERGAAAPAEPSPFDAAPSPPGAEPAPARPKKKSKISAGRQTF